MIGLHWIIYLIPDRPQKIAVAPKDNKTERKWSPRATTTTIRTQSATSYVANRNASAGSARKENLYDVQGQFLRQIHLSKINHYRKIHRQATTYAAIAQKTVSYNCSIVRI